MIQFPQFSLVALPERVQFVAFGPSKPGLTSSGATPSSVFVLAMWYTGFTEYCTFPPRRLTSSMYTSSYSLLISDEKWKLTALARARVVSRATPTGLQPACPKAVNGIRYFRHWLGV